MFVTAAASGSAVHALNGYDVIHGTRAASCRRTAGSSAVDAPIRAGLDVAHHVGDPRSHRPRRASARRAGWCSSGGFGMIVCCVHASVSAAVPARLHHRQDGDVLAGVRVRGRRIVLYVWIAAAARRSPSSPRRAPHDSSAGAPRASLRSEGRSASVISTSSSTTRTRPPASSPSVSIRHDVSPAVARNSLPLGRIYAVWRGLCACSMRRSRAGLRRAASKDSTMFVRQKRRSAPARRSKARSAPARRSKTRGARRPPPGAGRGRSSDRSSSAIST